jgi:hypothetical protein
MKTTRLLFSVLCLLFTVVCFTGCDDSSKIQAILDKALPADFTGPIEFGHKNPWIDFEVVGTGLRRTERGWTWESMRYKRNGRFSTGWINLGAKPQ